jgi:hypothetical protein
MNTISTQSRDHLRQKIFDEIKSLEESTRALKFRCNTLAPISRLPPETLATIFTFLSTSTWNEEAFHLEWIRVAHVCRQWREVALNHPRFWSHINFTKLTSAGIAEILARAKMAPLHMHLEVDGTMWAFKKVKNFARQLKTHISHTCHLSRLADTDISRLHSRNSHHLLLLSNPSPCHINLPGSCRPLPPSPIIFSIAPPRTSQASNSSTVTLVGSHLSSRDYETSKYMTSLGR